MNDVRFALRQLARRPGFTLTVVLVLGLGIGANSTLFTLVNALFLRTPPHVAEPDRLVRVNRTQGSEVTFGGLSYPDYLSYRNYNRTLAGLAAYDSDPEIVMARLGETTRVQVGVGLVSDNYFEVLGVRPVLGRFFLAEENRVAGGHAVAVVSHDVWTRHLASRRDALNSRIDLDGHPFTIVGVAPEGFAGVSPADPAPDVWVPIAMQPVVAPSQANLLERVEGGFDAWLDGIGRLRPGVTLEVARRDFTAAANRIALEYSSWSEGMGARVSAGATYHPAVRERLTRLLGLLAAVAGVVLLIACANVALLLLARASARRREFGVRLAIGAPRRRLVRQLLVEGVVLAALAGTVGLLFANWSAGLAGTMIPGSFAVAYRPDLTVAFFTFGLAAITVVLFALAPAWVSSRPEIVEELRGAAGRPERTALRSGLVVAQVALSLILVSAAALFARSLANAQSTELGFDPVRRLVLSVDLRQRGYSESEGKAFIRTALERLAAVPGVEAVATGRMLPFRGQWTTTFQADGVTPPEGQSGFDSGINVVSHGYFQTMGIPMVAGRGFEPRDDEANLPVAVVNQELARRLWGERDPIGLTLGWPETPHYTVVGVARNATYYDLGETPAPQLYVTPLQFYQPDLRFVLRTTGEPASLAGTVHRELHALDPDLVVARVTTLEDQVANETSRFRVTATLVGVLGSLALVLASAGLYGLLSYLVTQRTRELGVRMALGARRSDVAAVVVRRGVRLTALGVVIGGLVALGGSQLVGSFLFRVPPRDPVTFILAAVLLLSVSLLASWLPARRAARIDPLEALRHE